MTMTQPVLWILGVALGVVTTLASGLGLIPALLVLLLAIPLMEPGTVSSCCRVY